MLLSHNCIAFGIYRNEDTKSNTLLLTPKARVSETNRNKKPNKKQSYWAYFIN